MERAQGRLVPAYPLEGIRTLKLTRLAPSQVQPQPSPAQRRLRGPLPRQPEQRPLLLGHNQELAQQGKELAGQVGHHCLEERVELEGEPQLLQLQLTHSKVLTC